jgi:hypothetical protein
LGWIQLAKNIGFCGYVDESSGSKKSWIFSPPEQQPTFQGRACTMEVTPTMQHYKISKLWITLQKSPLGTQCLLSASAHLNSHSANKTLFTSKSSNKKGVNLQPPYLNVAIGCWMKLNNTVSSQTLPPLSRTTAGFTLTAYVRYSRQVVSDPVAWQLAETPPQRLDRIGQSELLLHFKV